MLELLTILEFIAGFDTGAHVCGPPDCPASSFTAIGAAFATQGYYVQSDILYMLSLTRFGNWAILVYIAAVTAGGISLVLGNPPRNYLWFFIGPAMYAWLIDSQQPVRGVQWMVAGMPQDQRIVWRLSEAGLRNANITHRMNIQVSSAAPPAQPVPVSIAFLWWDELVSSTIQWMVHWTGLSSLFPGNSNETNLGSCDTQACRSYFNDWNRVSSIKWDLLAGITGARFNSAGLRDAFVEFMASECGDILTASVKKENYVAAVRRDGRWLPKTIFHDDYKALTTRMVTKRIPMPRSLSSAFAATEPGSLSKFSSQLDSTKDVFKGTDAITCDLYLFTIIQAFRWEAGHIFFQTMTSEFAQIHPDVLTYHLFYGWDIKDKGGRPAGVQELMEYAYNLTLLHLIKNEFEFAPDIADTRYKQVRAVENYTDAYHKELGGRSKYGELFTWARMVPWLQGILLYALAMGYPVAAVLMIMPAWSKTIFTWMSFWAWVKLWDLGFAIVMTMERSLWAMFGNNSTSARWNEAIYSMSDLGAIKLGCADGGKGNLATCLIPTVESGNLQSSGLIDQSWEDALKLLDKSLILGVNLDFDLSNSFYMYIMAALYIAVPTVTGQLVLMGRSGASGMVNSMIGGQAQSGGQQAAEGHKGVVANTVQTASAVGRRTAQAKSMRATGLAAQALQTGNAGLQAGLDGSIAGQMASGLDKLASVGERGMGSANAARNAAATFADAVEKKGLVGLAQSTVALGSLAAVSENVKPNSAAADGGTVAGGGGGDASSAAARGGASGSPAAGGAATGSIMGVSLGGGLNEALKGSAGAFGQAMSIANSAEQLAWNKDAAGHMAASAGHGIRSFGAQQRSQGYQSMAGRMNQQAQFESEMAGWEWQRDHAASKAGLATVAGVFAGSMAPGAKPFSIDGGAARGEFGAGARAAFHYPTSRGAGGFFGQVGSGERHLNSQVGSQRMQGEYNARYAGSLAGELGKTSEALNRF